MENVTFEAMPALMQQLIQKVERLTAKVERLEPDAADKWISVKELCDYLPGNPKPATIYTWIHKMPHRKNGKAYVFRKSEIDEWLDKGGWTEDPNEVLQKRKR